MLTMNILLKHSFNQRHQVYTTLFIKYDAKHSYNGLHNCIISLQMKYNRYSG